MKQIILFLLLIVYIFILAPSSILALEVKNDIPEDQPCRQNSGEPIISTDGKILVDCAPKLACLANPNAKADARWICQKSDPASTVFGRVVPPQQILNLGFGAAGISSVLSNIINLIFTAAAIVTLFMILFSAFQWITSGGEKENVAKARGRLTWAIIGLVLLSLAFLFMRVLGNITGFSFFAENINP